MILGRAAAQANESKGCDLALGLVKCASQGNGHGLSRVGQHGGMTSAADEDPPRVPSWITPKATKGGASVIEGQGVHATEVITQALECPG